MIDTVWDMKPTPEQLSEIVKAMQDGQRLGFMAVTVDGLPYDRNPDMAQAAWDVIAPIVRAQVLEEAAAFVEGPYADAPDIDGDRDGYAAERYMERLAAAIRALKDKL